MPWDVTNQMEVDMTDDTELISVDATPLMSAEETDARCERVEGNFASAKDDMLAMYAGQSWINKGHDSWDEFCEWRFDTRIQLSRDDRREAVSQLRDAGLSTRAIGSAIGTSDATVRRDLDATATNDAVEQPTTNVGLDGRRRTNTPKPSKPEVEPTPEPEPGKPHVTKNTGQDSWYTPTQYIEAARRVFNRGDPDDEGISLDPASSDKAQETVKAHDYFTAETDGLAHEWHGSVWLNPPYGSPLMGRFVTKLIEEYLSGRVEEAIILVNNGTETAWAQDLLDVASLTCFHRGRIKFVDMDGVTQKSPLQGQMFCYLGDAGVPSWWMTEDKYWTHPFEVEFSEFGVVKS